MPENIRQVPSDDAAQRYAAGAAATQAVRALSVDDTERADRYLMHAAHAGVRAWRIATALIEATGGNIPSGETD